MQSILENLKSVSFLDNKIPAQYTKEFPEIISAEVYINPIPRLARINAINLHKLDSSVEILYFSEKISDDERVKSTTSIVITTDFISAYWSVSDKINVFNFCDIDKIEFNDYLYVFLDQDDKSLGGISNFYPVVKNFEDAPLYFTEEINKLIKYYKGRNEILEKLNDLDKSYIDFKNNHSQKEMLDMAKKDFSNQILILYDQYIVKYGKTNIPINLKYFEFLAYQYKREFKKALEITKYVLDFYNENLCLWHELKADTSSKLGDIYQAILNYNEASHLSMDSQQKLKFRDIILNLHNNFNENFINLPYQERKLILIDNELKRTPEETFIVLEKNNLPQNLQFPNNNPKKEELYILHPYLKDVYLLYSDHEITLFRDKFEEFSYLIQCLGAKKMTIKVAKGSKNSRSNLVNLASDNDSKQSKEGSIGINGIGLNGSINDTKRYEKNVNSYLDQIMEDDTNYSRTQVFNPTKKPYLPSDMIFYKNESTWKNLYKQRISGSINKHYDFLKSKSSYSISEKENTILKRAFTNYISGGASYLGYSASGSLNTEKNENISEIIESTFSESESIEWKIEIEFESINNLTEDNDEEVPLISTNKTSSAVEQDYREEVEFMLEDDGIIDDKERRVLDRLRVKMDISAEVALRIEHEVLSVGNLTEDEKEYIEEFQEMLNDGEITDKERKILNRFANRLDISDERVTQLENNIK